MNTNGRSPKMTTNIQFKQKKEENKLLSLKLYQLKANSGMRLLPDSKIQLIA